MNNQRQSHRVEFSVTKKEQPASTTARKLSKMLPSIFILLALLFASAPIARAVIVKVDSTQNWIGYMNFLNPNKDWKEGGSAWALADLRAGFSKTNVNAWPMNDWAWIKPNTNTYDPTNPFWNNPDGSPGQTILEQNFYVDVYTNFGGQTVTFEGIMGTNTLSVPTDPNYPTNGYLLYAVVKEFTAPNYGWVGLDQVELVAGAPFTVSRAIPAGGICQYGFLVIGPNAGPGAGNPSQGMSVVVQDPDPAITLQPEGGVFTTGDPISLESGGAGATALSFQWQKNGTNVVDGGTISGANTENLVISSSTDGDSGAYTFIVTDNAGAVTSAVANVTVLNVLITEQPADQRLQVGSTAVFNAEVTSPSDLTFRWAYVTNDVTNFIGTPFPYRPSNASGFATNTLTLTNVQLSDSGSYILRIYDGSNFVWTDFANLLVKTPAQYVNFLENPGFENGKSDESPWVRFQSDEPTFGAVQDSSDTYFGGGNVNVYAGTYVSYTTFNADYSGIYQDVPATPGQIFTANMQFYNASGDPLPGTEADNESYLEVQFRQGTGGEGDVLQQYVSAPMSPLMPQNVWTDLYATNAGGYGGGTGEDGLYLVAPPGTTMVRFQVTMHDITGASVGAGSLYYDSAQLLLKEPAKLMISNTGDGMVSVSWNSLGATTYQVQFKEDIGDSTWSDLEQVSGTGSLVTRDYPATGKRLYRVLTL